MNDLRQALTDALAVLLDETKEGPEALFGERVLEPTGMSAAAAHAVGIIEGAAIAMGMTALELLSEVDAE